jgi:hypothetical protein
VLVDIALVQPALLVDAFNPVSLNIAGLALCAVARVTQAQPIAELSSLRN